MLASIDPQALLGLLGGAASGALGWWRATRVTKARVDDAAWARAIEITDNLHETMQATIKTQGDEISKLRRRLGRAETAVRLAANRVDQLVALVSRSGVEVPPGMLSRPWEAYVGDDRANGAGD